MKGSRKGILPPAFTAWLATTSDDWQPSYSELRGSVRNAVIDALFAEQRGLCVYCGRKLCLTKPGKTFHIEHFRPQSMFPYHQITYHNLFLSCGQEDVNGLPAPTCGNEKGSWFDPALNIYPSYPSCTKRFRFLLNGGIEPADPTDIAAAEAIRWLRLDHPELNKDRENTFLLIDQGVLTYLDYWDTVTGTAESYAHAVYQRESKILP
jgi:uncharacterized protein (TIGR02646 family)